MLNQYHCGLVHLYFGSLLQETRNLRNNKIAFQWDAYHQLVDRIPACTAPEGGTCRGCTCPGGTCPGDTCHLVGVCILACNGADPPPVNRITDTCKNITFPRLHLRAVKISISRKCLIRTSIGEE